MNKTLKTYPDGSELKVSHVAMLAGFGVAYAIAIPTIMIGTEKLQQKIYRKRVYGEKMFARKYHK